MRASTSDKRFPDGAHYRIEIPSTEGPECLEAALEEAARLDVVAQRYSQGSGVLMLTDAELDAMAAMAAEACVEVSLFARPNASWGPSAMARSTGGAVAGASAFGSGQLEQVLNEARRAAAHGFRSVLIGDVGALDLVSRLRADGGLPPDFQIKTSVSLPVTNAATARVLENLGANTINIATDLPLDEIADIRAAVDVPLDVYVESPSSMGGLVRLHEIPDIIRVAAPVHIKFGLSGAPDVYPAGAHLTATAVNMTRERIHRARLGMEIIERAGGDYVTTAVGHSSLAIPVAAGTMPQAIETVGSSLGS